MPYRSEVQNLVNDGADVSLHSSVASLPVPTLGTDGGSVAHWNGSVGSIGDAEVKIEGSASGTVEDAHLFGLEGSIWYDHGPLNNGEDIVLTATRGFKARVKHSPRATRYAIGGTVTGGINVSASIYSLEKEGNA